MDIFDFVTVLIIVLAGVVLVNRALTLADARTRLRLEIERKRAAQNAASAELRLRQRANTRGETLREQAPEPPYDVGPWVPQLLESFGIDPETIYEENMPDDLARFLPLVKGYVKSQGGLDGMLEKVKKGQEDQTGGSGPGPI